MSGFAEKLFTCCPHSPESHTTHSIPGNQKWMKLARCSGHADLSKPLLELSVVTGRRAESGQHAVGSGQAKRPGFPWLLSILAVPSFSASPSLIDAMCGHGCDQSAALVSFAVRQPGAMWIAPLLASSVAHPWQGAHGAVANEWDC